MRANRFASREFYLLDYFKPAQTKVSPFATGGLETMKRIGCTGCHVQDLVIEHDRRVADVTTSFDPERGIWNRLFPEAETLFESHPDGDPYVPDDVGAAPRGSGMRPANMSSGGKRTRVCRYSIMTSSRLMLRPSCP